MIDFRTVAGFGIAGNFAHHLEQAGESEDFVDVAVDETDAPKGIFPFYIPNVEGFLGTYPLSDDTLFLREGENCQMEPEVALLCDVVYENQRIISITPTAFSAYNDCSIRRKGASKISQKKNWGANTKGVSKTFIDIDTFSKGGVMDDYRIASFIKRKGKLIAYGEDTQMLGYSYFYEKLNHWMVSKFQSQVDGGPLEAIGEYLEGANCPSNILISIGATRYTAFGETHFLEPHDELFVVLYNSNFETPQSVQTKLMQNEPLHEGSSCLHQDVKYA